MLCARRFGSSVFPTALDMGSEIAFGASVTRGPVTFIT